MTNMLNRFCQRAALCGGALALCFSLAANANEVQDANQLFKQGQYGRALDKVNGFLGHHPKDAQARFLKGLILAEQGKTNDAIGIFSALTRDYPELPEPYNNLAVLYAGQGNYDKARIALEMAIRTHPSYATAHENLGDIYAKMASQAYDRALQLDRNNKSTKTKLALIKELFSDERGRTVIPAAPETPAAAPAAPVAAQPVVTEPVVAAKPAPAPAAPAKVAVAETKPAVVAPQPVAAPQPTTAPIASKPAAAPKAAPKTAHHSSKEVIKAVHGWAAAWSAQDVKKYLSYYADDFKTPHGMSRKSWESQRQRRLTKPKYIRVRISKADVKFDDATHAVVTFHESYHASHFATATGKTLDMEYTDGRWLIREERSQH